MVTHRLDLLDAVDRIIIMKEGRIVFDGSYEEAKDVREFQELNEEKEVKDQQKEEINENQDKSNLSLTIEQKIAKDNYIESEFMMMSEYCQDQENLLERARTTKQEKKILVISA